VFVQFVRNLSIRIFLTFLIFSIFFTIVYVLTTWPLDDDADDHDDDGDNDNNNSPVQFLFIYVPSQQLQGQLQTQHSVDTSNYIMEQYNIKSKANYRQVLEKIHINRGK
jgi:hypothetical protein